MTRHYDLRGIKKINTLINRFNKNIPYSDSFQPLYNAGIHAMFDPWIDIEIINGVYYPFYNNKRPDMVIPPLTVNGDYPTSNELIMGLINVRNRMKECNNCRGSVIRINAFHNQYLKSIIDTLPSVVEIEKWPKEYIYSVKEHVELKGKKFKGVRKDINKFKRENETHVIDIRPKKHIDELVELNNVSINEGNWDAQAFKSTFDNYSRLKKVVKTLDGFVIVDKDEAILGVNVFYRVKYTPTVISFIKRSSHAYTGLSEYISQCTAIKIQEKHPRGLFINKAPNRTGKRGLFKKKMQPIRFETGSNLILKERVIR